MIDAQVAAKTPAWRNLFGFDALCFLGLWLALLAVGPMLFRDPGALWHPVMGEWMLSHGQLITHGVFSATEFETPWVPQSWLAEVLLAAIYRVTGLDGLLLLAATLLAGLYTWLASRLRQAGIHPMLICVLLALSIAASTANFHMRPHLFTMLGMAWTLAWLADVEAGRRPLWHLWLLVPGYLLWANIHAGWLGGMATFGFVAGGWIAYRVLKWEQPLTSWRQAVMLVVLTGVLLLTMLATPYGLAMPQVWMSLMGSAILPKYIVEHMPLLGEGVTPFAVLVLLVGALYIAALVGTFRWPRVTWLVVLVWFWLSISRQRQASLFALTVLVVLPDIWPQIRCLPWLAKRVTDFFTLDPRAAVTRAWQWDKWSCVLPTAAVLLAAGLQIGQVSVPLIGRHAVQLENRFWPVELIPQLQQYAAAQPAGTPVFTDFWTGGFVMYAAPSLRVFIDDRCELYGDAGLQRYIDGAKGRPALLEAWADQYQLQLAVVRAQAAFDLYLAQAPGWKLVARAPAGAIYQRVPGPQAVPAAPPAPLRQGPQL